MAEPTPPSSVDDQQQQLLLPEEHEPYYEPDMLMGAATMPFLSYFTGILCLMLLLLLPSDRTAIETAPKSFSDYYESGLTHFNKGEHREAIIQLKNALQQNPDNLSARLLTGQAYLELGNPFSAEVALRTALQDGADENFVLPLMGRIYLQQEQYYRIFDEIKIERRPPEVRAAILIVRGQARAALRQWDQAHEEFTQAASLIPHDPKPLLEEAQLFLKQNKLVPAETFVDKAIELASENAEAWYWQGELRRLNSDLNGAVDSYTKSIQIRPNFVQAWLSRAVVLVDLGKDKDAAEDIKFLQSLAPNQPQVAYLQALILVRAGNLDEARKIFELAKKTINSDIPGAVIDQVALNVTAGVLNFALSDFANARVYLKFALELNPNHIGARKLLGAIAIQQANPTEAIELLEPAIQLAPDDPQLLALLGSAYIIGKQYNKATQLYEKAVNLPPDHIATRTQLALGKLAIGQVHEAVREFESVLSVDSGVSQAGILLSFIYLKQGKYDEALQVAHQLITHEAGNPAPYNLAGVIHLHMGSEAEARARLEQALRVNPDYLPAQLNLANIDLQEGKTQSAKARFQAILEEHGWQTEAMIGLARIAEAENNLEEATRWLGKVRAADANAVSEQLHLVAIYTRNGELSAALTVAEGLRTQHTNNTTVLEAVSRAELALGMNKAASDTLYQLALIAVDSLRLLYRTARLQMQAEDLAGAALSLIRVRLLDPGFLPAHVSMIEIQTRQGKLDEALTLATWLRETYRQTALGDLAVGEVLMRMGDFTKAAEALQQAYQKEPTARTLIRLYQSYRETDRSQQAIALLEAWIGKHPQDEFIQKALATAYMDTGQSAKARVLHEKLLSASPDDPALLNNLALIYQQAGVAPSLALEYASKAYQLAPQQIAILDTLGWVLAQQGEAARGLRYLREAQARSLKDPQINYHLGAALNRLGRQDEARRLLEAALQTGKRFDGADEARALLQQLSTH